MTALLNERLRVLAAQTHTLEEKVSSLGWMAGPSLAASRRPSGSANCSASAAGMGSSGSARWRSTATSTTASSSRLTCNDSTRTPLKASSTSSGKS